MDRPNLLLLITDQQRYPQHWPDEPGLDARADAERRRARAHRAQLHARVLQHVHVHAEPGDALLGPVPGPARPAADADDGRPAARPRATCPFVLETAARDGRSAARSTAGGWRGRSPPASPSAGERGGDEPELKPETQSIAHVLRAAGYHVALKGKWHLTKPVEGVWSRADTERLEREFGFADWDPPDAGENAKAENFGGGIAGDRGGLGRGLHARDRGMARAGGPARAVLPRRLADQPARRARLPGAVREGRLHARRGARDRGAAAADARRGPVVEAERPRADADGPGGVPRPPAQRADAARLRQLLRLPAPRGRREDRARCCSALGRRRRPRARCARAR